MYADERFDILAEPTLTELIDNNKAVLETKIKPDTIRKFINMLLEDQKEKYVSLIRALCLCNYEPMINNQTELSKMILSNNSNRNSLVFPVRKNENSLEINVRNNSWIPLSEFQTNLESEENQDLYRFFICMVHLLAELCYGKNFLAISKLKSIYSFEICCEVISNRSYNEVKAFVDILNEKLLKIYVNQIFTI